MNDKAAEQRLGDVLRIARTARGWTQETLAERACVSTDTVRRIETAKFSPTLGVIAKLARGLRVDLETLWAGIETVQAPRLGLDGLTEPEREFVTALARLLAAQREPAKLQGVGDGA